MSSCQHQNRSSLKAGCNLSIAWYWNKVTGLATGVKEDTPCLTQKEEIHPTCHQCRCLEGRTAKEASRAGLQLSGIHVRNDSSTERPLPLLGCVPCLEGCDRSSTRHRSGRVWPAALAVQRTACPSPPWAVNQWAALTLRCSPRGPPPPPQETPSSLRSKWNLEFTFKGEKKPPRWL